MIGDVKADVEVALAAVTDVAMDAQGLMVEVGEKVRVILASTDKVTSDLTAMVDGVRNGRGTIGKLVNDDALVHERQEHHERRREGGGERAGGERGGQGRHRRLPRPRRPRQRV